MKGVKLFIFVFIFLFSIIITSAIEIPNCNVLEYQKSLIIGKTLPEKVPFTDEIVNIYIENETFGNIVLENKTIKDFSCKENQYATYKVHINNLSSLNDFMNSKDFIGTYKNKTKSGEIDINGVGLGKKIKLSFVNLFLKFY
jgi:hypothetical protein